MALAGELIFGALGGLLSHKVTSALGCSTACNFGVSMAGAATGALAYDYALSKETGSGKKSWPIQNPVTFVALTGAYGTLIDVLLELVLPEFEIAGATRALMTLGAFGAGAYQAYETGPTIGTLVEIMTWAIAESLGEKVPEPPAVRNSKGVKHLFSIFFMMGKDSLEIGIWRDAIKPMIDNLENAFPKGTFLPGFLVLALWDLLLSPGRAVSGILYQILAHMVDIVAAVIHSSVKK